MPSNRIISSVLTERSSPSMAFLDSFIIAINTGITTGKLKIAIKVALFPAFEAIADIIVKAVAKLKLPITTHTKYKNRSPIGLLNTIL
ncbi:hypothetical protein D3C87_2000540 [compost metagenome]